MEYKEELMDALNLLFKAKVMSRVAYSAIQSEISDRYFN
ncbi:hypothetical protein LCGC14_2813120 [marine sediment metagenome]|uniref:Uncharacterized protein n=1 Tax=marine sediment metagenome TaxID=412755 RepID=A0A0F9ASR1_9ZZZZ